MKLSDFGLAKISTKCNSNVGTPEYAAPQIRTGKYTQKVDIFSLGCLLFQLYKTQLPNSSNTPQESIKNYLQLQNVNPTLQKIAKYNENMLSQDPDDRPTIDDCIVFFNSLEIDNSSRITCIIQNFEANQEIALQKKQEMQALISRHMEDFKINNAMLSKYEQVQFDSICQSIIYYVVFQQNKIQLQIQSNIDNSIVQQIIQLFNNSTITKLEDRTIYGQFGTNKPIEFRSVKFLNGDIILGAFKNNEIYGICKVIQNGTEYLCEYNKGQKNGIGKKQDQNGIYIGEWQNDVQCGLGQIQYANGDSYSGQFENGNKHGYGVQQYKNKEYYSGYWENNLFRGQGTCQFNNGEQFEGIFENGERCGLGILKLPNGQQQYGYWKGNKIEGKMIIMEPNGDYSEYEQNNGKQILQFQFHQVRQGNMIDELSKKYTLCKNIFQNQQISSITQDSTQQLFSALQIDLYQHGMAEINQAILQQKCCLGGLQVIEQFQSSTEIILILELNSGMSLNKYLQQKKKMQSYLPLWELIEIMIQITKILEELPIEMQHQTFGLDNFIFTASGNMKLIHPNCSKLIRQINYPEANKCFCNDISIISNLKFLLDSLYNHSDKSDCYSKIMKQLQNTQNSNPIQNFLDFLYQNQFSNNNDANKNYEKVERLAEIAKLILCEFAHEMYDLTLKKSKRIFTKDIDVHDFPQLCEIIITNLAFQKQDIFAMRQEIQTLSDTYSETKSNDNSIFGQYKTGREIDFKKIVYKSGDIFIGACGKNQKSQGFGLLKLANQEIYLGEFLDGKRNGLGKQKFISGNVYIGEWKNNKRNGFGKLSYSNGDKYEGEWMYDKRHGIGIQKYANGGQQDGYWKYDKFTGNGKLIYANGDKYEGYFVDNLRYGKGKCNYANGDVFEGEWMFDNRYGKGKYVYANGDIQIGQWLDDKFTGNVKLIYANGDKYEGEWMYDKRDGKGKYESVNGGLQDGYWKYDKFTGNGILIYANGDKYEGYFEDSNRCWKGKLAKYNGVILEGIWDNDTLVKQVFDEIFDENDIIGENYHKFSGYIKLKYQNGDYSQGNFENGRRCGNGKCNYANGDVYEGEWFDDYRSGNGKYEYVNGGLQVGQWHKDKFTGNGMLIYTNGDKYEGYFEESKRCMNGKCQYANGDVYEGEWMYDKRHGIGIQKYANGGQQDGKWKYDKFTGNGMLIYANGDKYEGYFEDSRRCGRGKCNYANGDVYEGEWMFDNRYGQGKYEYANGGLYEGEWEDDLKNGNGQLKYFNGDKYFGCFKYGKMWGKGKLIKQNDEILEGIWENNALIKQVLDGIFDENDIINNQYAFDKFSGYVKIKYNNGDYFEGNIIDKKRQGQGACKYANGDKYEGYFVDNQRCGKGKCNYTNGDVYEGEWFDDYRSGNGKQEYTNGDLYDGLWHQDKFTGYGILIYANGDKYEGYFEDSKRCWKGKLAKYNGVILEGIWDNDTLVKQVFDEIFDENDIIGKNYHKFSGYLKLKYQNGDYFQGNFENGRRCGNGKCNYANGDIFEGTYNYDFYPGALTNEGTHKYANGDIYIGWMKYYKKDQVRKRCGKGKLIKQNGQIMEGVWENDQLIQKRVEQ